MEQIDRNIVRVATRFDRVRADRERIWAYLSATPDPKLNLGCGETPLDGWLNTDVNPASDSIVVLDASQGFPLPDTSIAYIFSEHHIEHLDFGSGFRMLRESARVLRPGGTIRICTPDLCRIMALVGEELSPEAQAFRDWFVSVFFRAGTPSPGAFVVNGIMRMFGHRFLYDTKSLEASARAAGFSLLKRCAPGQSEHEALRGIDSRAFGDNAPYNAYETMVLEATK